MARLATVPHAPITRISHRTGEIDHPETGSFVNLENASIFCEDDTVVVQHPTHDWRFDCVNDGAARAYAAKLTMLATRRGR